MPKVAGEANLRLVDGLLFLQAVLLEFEVEVLFAEEFLVLARQSPRFVLAALQEQRGNLAGEAGAESDQPAGVLGQQVAVDAGLVVEALDVGVRHQADEVAIAFRVLREEDQVLEVGVELAFLLEAAARSDVDFAPDDRLDARLLAGLVEGDDAVEHAVIGEGQPGEPVLRRPLRQILDPAGAIEQAVLGVHVQVGKRLTVARLRHRVSWRNRPSWKRPYTPCESAKSGGVGGPLGLAYNITHISGMQFHSLAVGEAVPSTSHVSTLASRRPLTRAHLVLHSAKQNATSPRPFVLTLPAEYNDAMSTTLRRAGFSLVEMLVVMAIIAILAGMLLVAA